MSGSIYTEIEGPGKNMKILMSCLTKSILFMSYIVIKRTIKICKIYLS